MHQLCRVECRAVWVEWITKSLSRMSYVGVMLTEKMLDYTSKLRFFLIRKP